MLPLFLLVCFSSAVVPSCFHFPLIPSCVYCLRPPPVLHHLSLTFLHPVKWVFVLYFDFLALAQLTSFVVFLFGKIPAIKTLEVWILFPESCNRVLTLPVTQWCPDNLSPFPSYWVTAKASDELYLCVVYHTELGVQLKEFNFCLIRQIIYFLFHFFT